MMQDYILTQYKLLQEQKVRDIHVPRFERIHADVMQSFCDAFKRLQNCRTEVEAEKDLIRKRLGVLDERIDIFRPNPVSWPKRFEIRLLEIIRHSTKDDLDFYVNELLHLQEKGFTELLKAYRELQPTNPPELARACSS